MAWDYPYLNPYRTNQHQRGEAAWVQGAEGAKAEYVEPGKVGFFFDSETQRFFIKAVDASGVPAPLRVFRYEEEHEAPAPVGVTRDEFDALRKSVEALMKGEPDNEQSAV